MGGPSVEAMGESIRVRRGAPGSGPLGEVRMVGSFAEAGGVAVGRLPHDVHVPESRSSGAIRSEGAAAEVDHQGLLHAGSTALVSRCSASDGGTVGNAGESSQEEDWRAAIALGRRGCRIDSHARCGNQVLKAYNCS